MSIDTAAVRAEGISSAEYGVTIATAERSKGISSIGSDAILLRFDAPTCALAGSSSSLLG